MTETHRAEQVKSSLCCQKIDHLHQRDRMGDKLLSLRSKWPDFEGLKETVLTLPVLLYSYELCQECQMLSFGQLNATQARDMAGQGSVGLPSLRPSLQARNWGLLTAHITVKSPAGQEKEHALGRKKQPIYSLNK